MTNKKNKLETVIIIETKGRDALYNILYRLYSLSFIKVKVPVLVEFGSTVKTFSTDFAGEHFYFLWLSFPAGFSNCEKINV